jgi:hypothetical protein
MQAAKQFSFRLPQTTISRVEACAEEMRSNGLDVTRADVVRLLLNHALDATQCQLDLLLGKPTSRKASPRRRR